jgi:acyl dehydratase
LSFTAAGAGLFPHVVGESLIGFVEVTAKFLKAVYPGDTLYPALEITELTPQRTTGLITMRATVHNQHGALVLDGTHKYLVNLKRQD